jgi:hypothetical protein
MPNIQWIAPQFNAEAHELDRYTAGHAAERAPVFWPSREAVRLSFAAGHLAPRLDPGLPLHNFDEAVVGFYRHGQVSLDQVVAYYTQRKRRAAMIARAYLHGGTLTAIVALRVNNAYYELVSGNTRLVLGQVLGKDSTFWVVDVGLAATRRLSY